MISPRPGRDALMVFHDDSSLATARATADLLAARGLGVAFMQVIRRADGPPGISPRQLAVGLGPWPIARVAVGADACDEDWLARFGFVVSAKFPTAFRRLWEWRGWRFRAARPVFVALFPGLELTRGRGYVIRRHADVVCLPTAADLADYRARRPQGRPPWQAALRFHPALVRRPGPLPRRDRLVFFPQSVAPATPAGRRDVAALLVETARANPGLEIVVKLRHRPDENRHHTHVETLNYPALLADLGAPSSIRFDDGDVDGALGPGATALTCSSTAGFEALALGLPTMFFLDHAEAAADPLNAPMRALLEGGGPLATRAQVRAVAPPAPDPAWLDGALSTTADLDATLAAVEALRRTPPPSGPAWRTRLGRAAARAVAALS